MKTNFNSLYFRYGVILYQYYKIMTNTHSFVVGDKISYNNKEGTVSRVRILGMKPNTAIQVIWNDATKISQILQGVQLNDVKKL